MNDHHAKRFHAVECYGKQLIFGDGQEELKQALENKLIGFVCDTTKEQVAWATLVSQGNPDFTKEIATSFNEIYDNLREGHPPVLPLFDDFTVEALNYLQEEFPLILDRKFTAEDIAAPGMKMRHQRWGSKALSRAGGFSIVELLIAVAIILVIAAIAIPKLIQAHARSQEVAGADTLRSVDTALSVYQLKWGSYPADLGALGGTCSPTVPATATAACVLDPTLASTLKAGGTVGAYVYTYAQVNSGSDFTINGDPATGSQAAEHYYVDSGLTIHANATTKAAVTDPTL